MGYIVHDAIIVTDHGYGDDIEDAHTKATELGLETSSIIQSRMNGYRSFLIAPDGSKEGWRDSDEGEQQRGAFIDWLHAAKYEDSDEPADRYYRLEWVAIRYGGDSETAVIANSSFA